jgi:hypothetical protein
MGIEGFAANYEVSLMGQGGGSETNLRLVTDDRTLSLSWLKKGKLGRWQVWTELDTWLSGESRPCLTDDESMMDPSGKCGASMLHVV